MSALNNYDIGIKIKERLNINPDDDLKIIYFIGFRIMIYCDEMHDFGEKNLSQIKSKKCKEDIEWFITQFKSDNKKSEILNKYFQYLTFSPSHELSPDDNLYLKVLIELESNRFKQHQITPKEQGGGGKIQSRGRAGKDKDYITSNFDEIAKNISEIVLTKIFKISKSHFLEIYGCSLRGTNFQNWIKKF